METADEFLVKTKKKLAKFAVQFFKGKEPRGSGFLYVPPGAKKQAYVLTAAHVLSDADSLKHAGDPKGKIHKINNAIVSDQYDGLKRNEYQPADAALVPVNIEPWMLKKKYKVYFGQIHDDMKLHAVGGSKKSNPEVKHNLLPHNPRLPTYTPESGKVSFVLRGDFRLDDADRIPEIEGMSGTVFADAAQEKVVLVCMLTDTGKDNATLGTVYGTDLHAIRKLLSDNHVKINEHSVDVPKHESNFVDLPKIQKLQRPVIIGIALILLAVIAVGLWSHTQRERWKEQNNILMKNGFEDAESEQLENAFKTAAKRCEVGTITFQDSLDDISENAVDVSQKGNKKVFAWAEKNGNLYDLYIAAEGKIYAPDDASSLFREMVNLTKIDFNNAFSTKNTENMNSMFNNCQNLKELDVGFFKTDKVTDMAGMFCNCLTLKSLDVSNFDTSCVEKIDSIFYGCSGLEELKLGEFDTSSATNMQDMFYNCSSLKALDVSGFDTSQVTSMRSMFSGCENLTKLDVSGFNTSEVTDMYAMFNEVSKVTELEVEEFDTSKVTNMSCIFRYCEGLTQLNLNNFNTGAVTDMSSMFAGCLRLEKLDLSSFSTWLVTDMSGMFAGCWSLAELDLSSFDTWCVTDMSGMFKDCSRLTELDLSSFVTNNVTDMSSMFSGCEDIRNLKWSNADDLHYVMVLSSDGLPRFKWVRSDTCSVTNMSSMFSGCEVLTELNLSSFDTGNVTDMSNMFSRCMILSDMDLSKFDTRNVTNMSGMFDSCFGVYVGIEKWDLSSVAEYDNFMIDGMTVNGRPWEELFS